MDRVPPKLPNTASRLIAMAVSLVGEAQPVAVQMKCSQADFRRYCAGQTDPSSAQLHRLISLIIQEQGKLIARNRETIGRRRPATRNTAASPCLDCFALVAAGPRTPAHPGLQSPPQRRAGPQEDALLCAQCQCLWQLRPLGWARL